MIPREVIHTSFALSRTPSSFRRVASPQQPPRTRDREGWRQARRVGRLDSRSGSFELSLRPGAPASRPPARGARRAPGDLRWPGSRLGARMRGVRDGDLLVAVLVTQHSW